MKLRIMNYELRMVRDFITGMSFAGLGFAGLMNLAGCSEGGPSSAGVWTETESGEKIASIESCSRDIPNNLLKARALSKSYTQSNCIAYERTYTMINVQGTALDESGSALKSARIKLATKGLEKETTTDDNGIYKFSDVIYKASYNDDALLYDVNYQKINDTTYVTYLDYTLQIASSDSSLISYHAINFENYKRISDGDSIYLEIPAQSAHKTTDMEFKTYRFSKGYNVCLDETDICHTLSEEEVEDSLFIMKNIPEGYYIYLCGTFTEGNETTSGCALLEKPLITTPILDSVSYVLPKSASELADSLEKVLVPVKTSADNPFMANGKTITKLIPAGSKELYWAEISLNCSDTAKYILLDNIVSKQRSNIITAKESLQDTLMDDISAYWNRNEVGFSFKVKASGSDLETAVLFSTVDSTESGLPRGYEVRQCETKSKNICVRVYSGLESAVTDTVVYGKADILDGEEHIFSMAMVGNHLSVAVDGEILRDTDLKVSDDFAHFTKERILAVGNVELKNFVMFTVDNNIRKSGELNWNRLKAWLITHQTFSK